jgi:glycosyltransferase involved in cell wall biosynthesis
MLGPAESQSMPMFSVCLPTYNRGDCLAKAIESVLDQDFDDYELLICDNASTDVTRAVIQSFDDRRIRPHFWPELVSMYANHNRCIGDSLGQWVVFLHSDDQLVPSALASYAQLITQFPNAALYYPRNSVHAMIADSEFPVVLDGQLGLPFILRCPAGAPTGCCFNHSVLEKLRFVEDNLAADLDFILRLLFLGKQMIVHDRPIVEIAENDQQASSNWHRSGSCVRDVERVLRNNFRGREHLIVESVGDQIDSWSDNEIARLLMLMAHAGYTQDIRLLESKIGHTTYRSQRAYRHVRLMKLCGSRFLSSTYRLSKNVSSRLGGLR